MNVIIKSRREGKTLELIKRCAEEGGYIVCESYKDADLIKEKATSMGLNIPLPITYNEFIQGRYYGKGISGFHIDNADIFIQHMSKAVEVKSITITK